MGEADGGGKCAEKGCGMNARRSADNKRANPAVKGIRAYMRILRELQKRPLSVGDLSKLMGADREPIGKWLRHMQAARLVRVGGYRLGKSVVRLWQAGDGPDAPYPTTLQQRGSPRRQRAVAVALPTPRTEMIAFLHMVSALKLGASRQELSDLTGISESVLHANIRYARKIGLIHIGEWDSNTPIYKFGYRSWDAPVKAKPAKPPLPLWRERALSSQKFAPLQQVFA